MLATSRYFLLGVFVVTPLVAVAVTSFQGVVTAGLVGILQLSLAVALLWTPHEASEPRTMGKMVDSVFGGLVGGASTLIGIGGGAYTTAYMVYGPRRSLRDAIAAGNLTGVAIGALSVAGFLVSWAWTHDGKISAANSVIPVAGLGILLLAGIVFSAAGVQLSRRISTNILKKILVVLLAASAARLLFS